MATDKNVRRADRARAALEYLNERGAVEASLPIGEVWAEVQRRVPLTEHEQELVRKGRPRGESDWRWASADLVAAGWLRKQPGNIGAWSITPSGIEALESFPGESLFREATRRYAAQRAERRSSVESSLPSEWLPSSSYQRKVLDAAQIWVEQSLRGGASMFSPSRDIWTEDCVTRLHRLWADAEKFEGKNFVENLAVQLDGESDDVKLFMAEVLTVQVLPIAESIGHAKKTERVSSVLETMKHPVSIPTAFDEAFGGGSFNPGSGMSSHVNRGVTLIVNLAKSWVELDQEQQEAALEDPRVWRQLVQKVPGDAFPTQRYSLMYLVHPGFFGPIVSADHRSQIREAFLGEIGGVRGDDADQDLRDIVTALQVKFGKPIDFYKSPLIEQWQGVKSMSAGLWVHDREPDLAPASEEAELADPRGFRSGAVNAQALADELMFEVGWVNRVIAALHRRGQVILYGPPGTGKTFVAQAITRAITGRPEAARRIQFHPSYTYEDFFAGYRPREKNGHLVFELVKGPLRRIADDARRDPEIAHVLLIDEINRANLSKVFGELYYLLEYRDEPIDLLYAGSGDDGGDTFTLPPNVLIIGTMNTADRSIALLDSAMRRRFSFFELHPDQVPVAGIVERWTEKYPQDLPIARLFAELNGRIRDRDDRIGPSHLLRRENLTKTDLEAIWEESILPLLEERHLGTSVDVPGTFALPALLRRLEAEHETRHEEAERQPVTESEP